MWFLFSLLCVWVVFCACLCVFLCKRVVLLLLLCVCVSCVCVCRVCVCVSCVCVCVICVCVCYLCGCRTGTQQALPALWAGPAEWGEGPGGRGQPPPGCSPHPPSILGRWGLAPPPARGLAPPPALSSRWSPLEPYKHRGNQAPFTLSSSSVCLFVDCCAAPDEFRKGIIRCLHKTHRHTQTHTDTYRNTDTHTHIPVGLPSDNADSPSSIPRKGTS